MTPKSLFYKFSRVHKCNWTKERMGRFEKNAVKPLFEVGGLFLTIFTYRFSGCFGPFLLKEWA
jgi:hypothetical protein